MKLCCEDCKYCHNILARRFLFFVVVLMILLLPDGNDAIDKISITMSLFMRIDL